MNIALQDLLIDLNGIDSCDGTILVSDGYNPPISQKFKDISQYFVLNKPPEEDSEFTIQSQISSVPIFTGEHFLIELSSHSFNDYDDDKLAYFLESGSGRPLLTWIILRGMTLSGTPPETASPSEFKFVFVARNEFKEVRVPFTIRIKLSVMFTLRLLMKYGSTLVSLIGAWLFTNKIFNIVGKRWYKHAKEFKVRIGSDVELTKSIFPISFVDQETKISQIIKHKLEDKISLELNERPLKPTSFIGYYFKANGEFTKEKFEDDFEGVITQILVNEEYKQYKTNTLIRKELIKELTLNLIIYAHLSQPQEKRTFDVFKSLKNKWTYYAEFAGRDAFPDSLSIISNFNRFSMN